MGRRTALKFYGLRDNLVKIAERTLCTIRRRRTDLRGRGVEEQAGDGMLTSGLLEALCHTYADLLRRQRTAASPLVNWTHTTKSIHKMYGTAKLDPYEREILYGFSYVIGRRKGKTVRGPLLTLAVEIEAVGIELRVVAADEVVRFNSLPFRTDIDTDAHDQALARAMEATPALPLTQAALQAFIGVLVRELPSLTMSARLDGGASAELESVRCRTRRPSCCRGRCAARLPAMSFERGVKRSCIRMRGQWRLRHP